MKRLFYLTTSLFFIIQANAQSTLEKGDQYFEKRYEPLVGDKADPKNINQAIQYYNEAEDSEEKFISLMRSYEFKGSWTDVTDEEAREAYNKGLKLGERVKDNYPNSAGIWYWYIANLSRWGDQVPITEAADEGILDEVKKVTEKIIDLDPQYEEAGALRLLGGVHLKAPNIPFILTWPSEEKAQELLNRAYDIAPENAANTYYYILMLLNEDKREEAKNALLEFMKRKPRAEYLLADKKFIAKGEKLYKDEFE